MTTNLGKVGAIGRFRPFHLGAYVMLDELCKQAQEVVIGIGSANIYDRRNPFTAEETETMIRAALHHDNYKIIHVPDFGYQQEHQDGQRWRQHVKEQFKELDLFVSGNAWVRDLLKDDYPVKAPAELIPRERWIPVKGSLVRITMARGGNDWKECVPEEVAMYLEQHHLVERFRKEFGLQTLSMLTELQHLREDAATEKYHVNSRS